MAQITHSTFMYLIITKVVGKRLGKIFLYAATDSKRYSTIRAILEQRLTCEQIISLPSGNFFGSENSKQLRSASIVILFASTNIELSTLSNQAEDFAEYNLILILEQTVPTPYKEALQLVPRYINLGLPNIAELRDIIHKIDQKDNKHI